MTSDFILLKFNSSHVSHSASYHGKHHVRNAKTFQVRIGSSRCTTPSPVHTQNAAVLYACVPVYARLRYEKLDRSNSSHRFPIRTAVRLRSRSWCSHWTPSDCPVASRRSLHRVPSCPVECELGFTRRLCQSVCHHHAAKKTSVKISFHSINESSLLLARSPCGNA